MVDSMGGINKFGMNFTPISSYNEIFKNNLSNANLENANDSLNNFQNILDNQMVNVQNQQIEPLNTGITMSVNPNDIHFNNSKPVDVSSVSSVSSSSAVSNTANSFGKALENGLTSLNDKQVAAQNAVETLASGGDISVHDVMIASQKSSLNMQMAMQLRNKMLAAYNELYQMRF